MANKPKDFYTDGQGRRRPIGGPGGGSGKGGGGGGKSGKVVAAGVLALGLVASTGGGGALLGGGGSASSVASESVASRVTKGKQAARKGKPDAVLRSMRLKRKRSKGPEYAECVARSFGQVQDFVIRNPCRDLARVTVEFDDGQGNTAVLSLAWARMTTTKSARQLKLLDDRDGTGDFYALGDDALAARGVSFTGDHYRGRYVGRVFTRAEVAPVRGSPDDDLMDGVADAAAHLPPPPR